MNVASSAQQLRSTKDVDSTSAPLIVRCLHGPVGQNAPRNARVVSCRTQGASSRSQSMVAWHATLLKNLRHATPSHATEIVCFLNGRVSHLALSLAGADSRRRSDMSQSPPEVMDDARLRTATIDTNANLAMSLIAMEMRFVWPSRTSSSLLMVVGQSERQGGT